MFVVYYKIGKEQTYKTFDKENEAKKFSKAVKGKIFKGKYNR